MSVIRNNNQPVVAHLDILKNTIAHTNLQLHELVHNHQKFVGTVHKLNNQAKSKITIDRPKEALVYLNQAQKILQYAASCGKNIDRNLIVCVLHNQACCHQRLWQLDKCSNYIEALIFNINSHLSSQESTLSKRSEQQFFQQKSKNQFAGKSINNRMQLSKYYLQFCAINSQLRNHNEALDSGRQAISIIKYLFKQLYQISKQRKDVVNSYSPTLVPDQPRQQFQQKMRIIHGISKLNDQTILDSRLGYISTAKQFIKKWNTKKLQQKNQQIKLSLQNFSIGNIMQIKPISFQQNKQSTIDIDNVMQLVLEQRYHGNPMRSQSYHSILNKVLLLTIGYFAIATQLRLIANQRFVDGERVSSKEYKQSEIYHLISIILSSLYIPFETLYMRHILTSFSNHYGNLFATDKLNQSNGEPILTQLFLSHLKKQQEKIMQKQNQKKSRSKIVPVEYTQSINGEQIDSPRKNKSKSRDKEQFSAGKKKTNSIIYKKQKSLSSKKQNTFNNHKITQKGRVKSQMIQRLISCLTPENTKLIKQRKQLKKSPKKIKSQNKIQRKKMKSSHNITKNKKKHKQQKQKERQKDKTIKGQYYKKVQKTKEKNQQFKDIKDNKKNGKLSNSSSCKFPKNYKTNRLSMKTSPSQQVLDRQKKLVKKNIDKYYF